MNVPEEDAAQKSKRQSIQAIMQDTSLTPQEKQLKIQAFMSGKEAPPPANLEYPRLLLLISRQTIDRDQKNQGVIETLIKGSKMGEPEVVDGADEANVKRREELFAISGLHAKYPQVFLLESSTAKPKFLGDSQGIQDLNEKGQFTKNAILGIEEEKEKDKENEPPADAAPNSEAPAENDADATPKSRALPTDGNNRAIDPPPKSRGLFCCFNSSQNKTPATTNGGAKSAPKQTKQASKAAAAPKAGTVPAKAPAPAASAPAPKAAPPKSNLAAMVNQAENKSTQPPAASSPPKKPEPPKPAAPQPLKKVEPPKAASPPPKQSEQPKLAAAPKPTDFYGGDNRASPSQANTNSAPASWGAPLKKTPPPANTNNKPSGAAAPSNTNNNKPSGAVASSNTNNNKSSGAAARAPPKTQAKKKDTKPKSSGASTSSHGSKPMTKAKITRVEPSDEHPKGTWYTQTTFQRLFGR